MSDDYGADAGRRVNEWIDSDLTAPTEIREAILQANPDFQKATDTDLDRLARNVMEQGERDLGGPGAGWSAVQESSTVAGRPGQRTDMVQTTEGEFLGKRDQVRTWTDRWGNVMGENAETGKRGKIRDSDQ